MQFQGASRQWTTPSPSAFEHRPLAKQKYHSHGSLHNSYLWGETSLPPRPSRPLPPINPNVSPLSSPSTSASPSTAYSPSIYYADTCFDEEEEDPESYPELSSFFYLPDADNFKSNGRPDSWILPESESCYSETTAHSDASTVSVTNNDGHSANLSPRIEPVRPISAPANTGPVVSPTPAGSQAAPPRPVSDSPQQRSSKLLAIPRLRTARSRPEITIPSESPSPPIPKISSPAVMHLTQSTAHPYSLKATRKCKWLRVDL
jgi:hypothetical protein